MGAMSRVRACAGIVLLVAMAAGCATSTSSRKRPLYGSTEVAAGGWDQATAGSGDGSTMLYGQTRVVDAPSAGTARTPSAGAGSGRGAVAVGIDSSGQVVTSGDFRGKVVVLDFWATWCGPCKASSPAFQQLSDRFAGDGRVMTLAIHTDQTGDPRAYMREHGYTFRMVPRGQEFAAAYGVNVLPTFIVLDGRGREIYRDTGMMGDTQRADIERLVRAQVR